MNAHISAARTDTFLAWAMEFERSDSARSCYTQTVYMVYGERANTLLALFAKKPATLALAPEPKEPLQEFLRTNCSWTLESFCTWMFTVWRPMNKAICAYAARLIHEAIDQAIAGDSGLSGSMSTRTMLSNVTATVAGRVAEMVTRDAEDDLCIILRMHPLKKQKQFVIEG